MSYNTYPLRDTKQTKIQTSTLDPELPFRNFTLTQFELWEKTSKKVDEILEQEQTNKYYNFGRPLSSIRSIVTTDELIQKFYYRLAIGDYEAIIYKSYKIEDEPVVKFARLLILLTGKVNYSSTTVGVDEFFKKSNIKQLANLCTKKYTPAILFTSTTTSLLVPNTEIANYILASLMRVLEYAKSEEVDPYLLANVMNKINFISEGLNNDKFDKGSINYEFAPDADQLMDLALDGSRIAQLKILELNIHTNYPENWIYGGWLVDAKVAEFRRIQSKLEEEIEKGDWDTITSILDIYKDLNENSVSDPLFNYRKLVNLCLRKCYDYFMDGGENVKIIVSYKSFLERTTLERLDAKFKTIENETHWKINESLYKSQITLKKRDPLAITQVPSDVLIENDVSTIVTQKIACMKEFLELPKFDWDMPIEQAMLPENLNLLVKTVFHQRELIRLLKLIE